MTTLPLLQQRIPTSPLTTYLPQLWIHQTGRFPVQSSNGNKYIFVLYDYNSNCILTEPIHNRTATKLLRAYSKVQTLLKQRCFTPKLQRLDNEASTILKDYMHNQQIDFQLVPPHMHRRNTAERAIPMHL